MEYPIIYFSKNWNNKLNNEYFTCFDLYDAAKYKLSAIYRIQVYRNKKLIEMNKAKLIFKETCLITDVDNLFCRVNLGESRAEFIKYFCKKHSLKSSNYSTTYFSKMIFKAINCTELF